MNAVTTLRTRAMSVFTGALLASLFLLAAAGASAQVFTEDFSYAAATPLNGTGGWSAHSGIGTNPPSVTSPGLSYSVYPGSGVGNKVNFVTSGEDNNHPFPGITSGSVYAAAIVNLSATQLTGDYFFHMVDGPIGGNKFRARLFAKKDPSSTNFAFGLQSSSSNLSLVYTGFTYTPGTSYLVVLKYTFAAGATNDPVALFVDPVIGAAEPAPTLSTVTASLEADIGVDGVAGVAIRQGTAGNAATGSIDGIRVATSWATVTGAYEIVASSGANGQVLPAGTTTVAPGGSQLYNITADPGYKVADVQVDAGSVGAVTSYTFTNVTANHTISATFVPNVNLSVELDKSRGVSSSTTPRSDQQYTGYGSWYKKYPGAKAELYINPPTDLGGASFTIDDIQSVTYHTYNVANPVPVEFFMAIYTQGSAHGWYEQRVNGEPYLKNGTPYVPAYNVWSEWTTTGAEALTLNDSNNSGNQGFYGAPTLADMQAGPINWSTWPGNPTAGSASTTPIDYGAQTVLLLSFQTGSGWSGFEGYLDAITIRLNNGDVYNVDLEATPYTLTTNVVGNGAVSKSPDQPTYAGGAVVQLTATPDPGYAFLSWSGDASGNANPLNVTMDDDKNITATFQPIGPVQNLDTGIMYSAIQPAIDDPLTLNGHRIRVDPGSYPSNVTLNKDLTLIGAKAGVAACGRVTGSPDSSESVISGPGPILLTLLAGSAGSTIDGFAFIGGTRAIESAGGPLHGLTIQNNHIAGFTNAGIFLNDPGNDVTVHQNNVDGSSKAGGGGLVHLDTDSFSGFHLTGNCILNGVTGTGFFVDGNRNVNATTRAPLIDGNRVENNLTGLNLGTRAFTDGAISNNIVRNNGDFATRSDGLQGGIRNTQITGNQFLGNGKWGLALTSFGNLNADRGASGNTITGNTFTGNDSAGYFVSAAMFAGHAASNAANYNDIVGNGLGGGNGYGVVYRGGEAINVQCNWWGDPSGPDFPPAHPNPPADNLQGPPSTIYRGWLNGPIGSTPMCVDPPEVSIDDVAVAEGNAGTTTFNFTVTLNQTSPDPTSVDWRVDDGTATLANNDYVDASGTLVIPANTLTGTISVDAVGDVTLESDETFLVVLSNPVNGAIVDGQGVGTIQNDDGAPSMSISDVSLAEGTAGPGYVTFNFVVSLSNPTDQAVTVQFQSADGSATEANFDYVPVSGTLTIPAKASSGTIEVIVPSDQTQESDETFFVNLSNPSNASIADAQGVGTILNDDGVPAISISDVSLTEGNAGLKDFTFNVTLSNASDQPITLTYQTQNNSAVAPGDYVAVGPTVLTIPSKNSLVTITIRVRGDVVFEGDETFFVNLSNPNGATLADAQGLGTIIDDEVTAVLLSMFEAATVTDGVELRWQFADATGVTSTWVERGPAVSGPWTRIAAEVSVRNGVSVALDRTAVAGRTYAYRLVAELAGGRQVTFTPAEGTAGERVTEFALARVSPNPTTDFARIEYTVAREAKVRVSIVDLQGRIVADVVDGVQGPGRYQAVWNGEGARGRMPAGMYFVRFNAGGKTGTKRIMLTH